MKKILITISNQDYIDFMASATECGKLSAKEMIQDLINYYVILQRNKEKLLKPRQKRLDES